MKIGQKITGYYAPLGAWGAAMGVHAPFIRLDLASDQSWLPGAQRLPSNVVKTGLSALLDTGSDVTRIDQSVAASCGLRVVNTVPSTFSGINVQTPVYWGQLFDGGAELVIGSELFSANLRAGGQHHDAIVGMDVLSVFRTVIDRKAQLVELTFVGP